MVQWHDLQFTNTAQTPVTQTQPSPTRIGRWVGAGGNLIKLRDRIKIENIFLGFGCFFALTRSAGQRKGRTKTITRMNVTYLVPWPHS